MMKSPRKKKKIKKKIYILHFLKNVKFANYSGSVSTTTSEKKMLAAQSLEECKKSAIFQKLFLDLVKKHLEKKKIEKEKTENEKKEKGVDPPSSSSSQNNPQNLNDNSSNDSKNKNSNINTFVFIFVFILLLIFMRNSNV